jgi:hypothetical protein
MDLLPVKNEEIVVGAPRVQALNDPTGAASPGLPRNVGIVVNSRAHRGRTAGRKPPLSGLKWCSPDTLQDLSRRLAAFARDEIKTLVIEGGDGTVRDVLSLAPQHFPRGLPPIAIIPSGKTNALALDLGIPRRWTLADAMAEAERGGRQQRAPLEVFRAGERSPLARGFLFGAGAFVKGTALAQRTHRMGMFGSLAVGISVAAAIGQTIFGSRHNAWRRGERMGLRLDEGVARDTPLYLVLASTLARFPLGMKPFGRERAGLKLVGIDAPPRYLPVTLPRMLAGWGGDRIDRGGVLRRDPRVARLSPSQFVLDGETFDGGPLLIRQGAPVDFVVPAEPRGAGAG